MNTQKEKYINIAIAVVTYILSIACGLAFGTIILCVGTAWLYFRTHDFWKYTLITLVLNIILSVMITISFMSELGVFNMDLTSEYSKVAAIFLFPCIIVLVILLFLTANILSAIRFGLQCLSCYLVKKHIIKQENEEIIILDKNEKM